MTEVRTISQKISFLFTAVTLFCVMLLNNQEIVTYTTLPENTSSQSPEKLNKAPRDKHRTEVKQKVSFEATTSYHILQLADLAGWPVFDFKIPLVFFYKPLLLPARAVPFISILPGFTIVPNAP